MNEFIKYSESLVIGVIGGLLASLITFFVRNVWFAQILPWYEKRIYKDAKIDGEWIAITKSSNNEHQETLLNIKQIGHKIDGVATDLTRSSGASYSFSGEIRNLILTISYYSNDKSELDRGTITLHLIDNGKRMSGFVSYYSSRKNVIVSSLYIAEKKSNFNKEKIINEMNL
jgi:hypothetical protein